MARCFAVLLLCLLSQCLEASVMLERAAIVTSSVRSSSAQLHRNLQVSPSSTAFPIYDTSIAIEVGNDNAAPDGNLRIWFTPDRSTEDFDFVGNTTENYPCFDMNTPNGPCRGGAFIPPSVGGCPAFYGRNHSNDLENTCFNVLLESQFCNASSILENRTMTNPCIQLEKLPPNAYDCGTRLYIRVYQVYWGYVYKDYPLMEILVDGSQLSSDRTANEYCFHFDGVPSLTPTASFSPSATESQANSLTETASVTSSLSTSPSQSMSPSRSDTYTSTTSWSVSTSASASVTATPSDTYSSTLSGSWSVSQSLSRSLSASASVSITAGASPTMLSSTSASASMSPSIILSSSITTIPSHSAIATSSATSSSSLSSSRSQSVLASVSSSETISISASKSTSISVSSFVSASLSGSMSGSISSSRTHTPSFTPSRQPSPFHVNSSALVLSVCDGNTSSTCADTSASAVAARQGVSSMLGVSIDAVVFLSCEAGQALLTDASSYPIIQVMYGNTMVHAQNATLVRFNRTSACSCTVRHILGYLAAVSSAASIQTSSSLQAQALASVRLSLDHAFANKSLANSTSCYSVTSGLIGTMLLEWTNFCFSGACPTSAGGLPMVATGDAVDKQWLGFIVMGAIIVCMTTALWICIWKKQKREDEVDNLRMGGGLNEDALVPHRHTRSSISDMLGPASAPPRAGFGSTGLARAPSLSRVQAPISGSNRRMFFGKNAGAEPVPNYDNPLHAAKGPLAQQHALRYASNVVGNRRSAQLSKTLSASNVLSPLHTSQRIGFAPEGTEGGGSLHVEAPRPLSSRMAVSPSRDTVSSLSSTPPYGSARRIVPSVGKSNTAARSDGDPAKQESSAQAPEPRPRSVDKRLQRDQERVRTPRGRKLALPAEDKPWVIPVGVRELQQEIIKKETVQLRRVTDVRGDQNFTQLRRSQSVRGEEMAKTLRREDSSYTFTAVLGRTATTQHTGKIPKMLSSRSPR